jgi:DNA mismatch repair protein MutL
MNSRSPVALLPDVLANQIAAGEVVERPASVVKELVENALDADASRIYVDVEEGGKHLVRVVDDGHGMNRDDATLSLERHATSKVRTADDLSAIATLGFRGEALPSIASVSHFRLITRTSDQDAATEIEVEGGIVGSIRDAGSPVGTRIEVRDLFENVPARLKFLKRTATEMSHINGYITASALGYPHVHFRLTHNGRTSQDLPPAPSLKHRIHQVLGGRVTDHLWEVWLDEPIQIRGFISEPTFTRTNQGGIHTFVNGRSVKDRVINHAVVSSYGDLLERGRYPYAVLYVHVPPDTVDVNVHPAKAEVRFLERGQVHEAIVGACRTSLASTPWVERGTPFYTPTRTTPGGSGFTLRETPSADPAPAVALAHDSHDRHDLEVDSTTASGKPRFFSRMKVLGQAQRTFLVCEGSDALHVIDPRAAHERVGYERIKSGWRASGLAQQQLLLPMQLDLTARESAAAQEHRDLIRRLGFDLEPFGGSTWQVMAVPALLGGANLERLIRDVLAELSDLGTTTVVEERLGLLFSAMAGHAVIGAGDALNESEIHTLLESMDDVELGANGPNGRPVSVTIPFSDLARRLHGT